MRLLASLLLAMAAGIAVGTGMSLVGMPSWTCFFGSFVAGYCAASAFPAHPPA
jgi:hypothetical protein